MADGEARPGEPLSMSLSAVCEFAKGLKASMKTRTGIGIAATAAVVIVASGVAYWSVRRYYGRTKVVKKKEKRKGLSYRKVASGKENLPPPPTLAEEASRARSNVESRALTAAVELERCEALGELAEQLAYLSEEEAMRLLFAAFDRDCDGKIDFAELAAGLRLLPLGDDADPETANIPEATEAALGVLLRFDEDSDQKLGPVEFVTFATELCSLAGDGTSVHDVLFLLLVKTLEAGDTAVEDEIIGLLTPLASAELQDVEEVRDAIKNETDGMMMALFTLMDYDEDGFVSFTELIKGLQISEDLDSCFECAEMYDDTTTERLLDYPTFARLIRRLCLEGGLQWNTVAQSMVQNLALARLEEAAGMIVETPGGTLEKSAVTQDEPLLSSRSMDSTSHLRRLSSSIAMFDQDLMEVMENLLENTLANGGGMSGSPTHSPAASPQKQANKSPQKQNSKKAQYGRSFSVASQETIQKLEQLDKRYADLEQRMSGLESQREKISRCSSLQEANELRGAINSGIAQLGGDLERFQFEGVDSVLILELKSGKEEAKSQRKALNKQVDKLMNRLEALKTKISGQ